ncbi:D-aminoacyl-tRNA deacylase [Halovenus halobia]|uniref:D-aminoacyl-tRNA deacylase n=1 Tax=Halovenus halobia TaxID=3396622 RepID=UPI003F551129
MLGIVVSRADSASVNIGAQLRAVAEWSEATDDSRPDADGGGTVYRTEGATLREFEDWHLNLDRPAEVFDDPDLLVFASRHSGETGPLLTAHHTGNFGPAEHGGRDNDLARACPNAHDAVLDALRDHAPEEYDVGMEGTHHGPSTVGAPSMFVEVGSAEPQWADEAACRAAARAILDLRDVPADRPASSDNRRRHLAGFGGGHYTPRFERVVRETGWSVGHVGVDWGLDAVPASAEQSVIEQAFEQSRAAYGLVDGDRPELLDAIEDAGYRAVSETWVRETDGVDLDLVEALETELGTIADGLRLGTSANTHEGTDFLPSSLPEGLVEEAAGIDRERVTELLTERVLAFQTEEGGTRPTGAVALAAQRHRETVLDDLVAVLEARYDEIQRSEDRIVARTEQFDPEKAKTFGLSEGPAFGRLASGEAVEVDGRTIPPEQVQTEREVTFEL